MSQADLTKASSSASVEARRKQTGQGLRSTWDPGGTTERQWVETLEPAGPGKMHWATGNPRVGIPVPQYPQL